MHGIESGKEGFNIKLDAEAGWIEAEFKTKWEKILNQEILSGHSTVMTYSKAEIKLFWMNDPALWIHCR
jgi:hypothetical protein